MAFLGKLVVIEEVGSCIVIIISKELAVVDPLSGVVYAFAVAEIDRPVLLEFYGINIRSSRLAT